MRRLVSFDKGQSSDHLFVWKQPKCDKKSLILLKCVQNKYGLMPKFSSWKEVKVFSSVKAFGESFCSSKRYKIRVKASQVRQNHPEKKGYFQSKNDSRHEMCNKVGMNILTYPLEFSCLKVKENTPILLHKYSNFFIREHYEWISNSVLEGKTY